MKTSHASFTGKDLPTSVWNSKVLYLPTPLATAHKDFLNHKGWLNNYQPDIVGGAGGQTTQEARDHVVNRFLNSAARMQFVCADPNDDQPDVREMVLDQLGDGHVYLLDLAAGNGAGTLAMLSLLCELRLQKTIPKLPLNVSIVGVDYSMDALKFYADLLSRITPWFEAHGINISLRLAYCDLMVSGEFSEVFESFLDDAKDMGAKRFMCVISALSGVGKEGLEKMHDSLKIAAAGLSHKKRSSSWLWVEPHVTKSWPTKFGDSMQLVFKRIKHIFFKKGESYDIQTDVPLLTNPGPRNFDWHDPHKVKTATSHVCVMAFRSESE
jgi:hypothetical protein